MAELAGVVLVIGITAYAVLGGADFGAGFWDLTAGPAERGSRVRGMVKRSMSPVWEANHVWLIFVLVILWTCFPPAFAAIMETLYVPLFLALMGIVLRGAAFALRGEAATVGEARALGGVFALSSVLTPFFFGCAIGAVAAGEVVPGDASEPFGSWIHGVPILAGLIAVATGAFLSAVFMAADAARSSFPDLMAAFRKRALGSGVVAGGLALAGIAVVSSEAPDLYDGLTSGLGIAAVVVSAAAGVTSLSLVWRSQFAVARYTAAIAVGAILAGMAIAIRPDFLPGQLTFREAAAGDSTLVVALVSVVVGLAIILPSLALLFRLTLSGKLDQEFHPIGTEGER